MICSLFNFCPQSSQSHRQWEALVDLASQTKLQAPQIETWNAVNQLSFCQFLEYQAPPHKRKANFLAMVLSLLLLHLLKPNFPQWNKNLKS